MYCWDGYAHFKCVNRPTDWYKIDLRNIPALICDGQC